MPHTEGRLTRIMPSWKCVSSGSYKVKTASRLAALQFLRAWSCRERQYPCPDDVEACSDHVLQCPAMLSCPGLSILILLTSSAAYHPYLTTGDISRRPSTYTTWRTSRKHRRSRSRSQGLLHQKGRIQTNHKTKAMNLDHDQHLGVAEDRINVKKAKLLVKLSRAKQRQIPWLL